MYKYFTILSFCIYVLFCFCFFFSLLLFICLFIRDEHLQEKQRKRSATNIKYLKKKPQKKGKKCNKLPVAFEVKLLLVIEAAIVEEDAGDAVADSVTADLQFDEDGEDDAEETTVVRIVFALVVNVLALLVLVVFVELLAVVVLLVASVSVVVDVGEEARA